MAQQVEGVNSGRRRTGPSRGDHTLWADEVSRITGQDDASQCRVLALVRLARLCAYEEATALAAIRATWGNDLGRIAADCALDDICLAFERQPTTKGATVVADGTIDD